MDTWAERRAPGPVTGASVALPAPVTQRAAKAGTSTARKVCYGLVAACLLGAAVGGTFAGIKLSHGGQAHGSGTSGSGSSGGTGTSGAGGSPTSSSTPLASPGNLANSALQAMPLVGCPMGGYNVEMPMGGQTYNLLADSGSSMTAVAASSCKGCDDVSPTYSGLQSGTYTGKDTHEAYLADGGWSGPIYSDTVGGSGSTPAFKMTFAAITQQTEFFSSVYCSLYDATNNTRQGILGLNPGAADTDNFIEKMASEAGLPKAYSAQICDQGGNLWLGGYNPAALAAAPQFVKMPAAQAGNGVTITSMGVGTSEVGTLQDLGAMAVDTGTSVLFLPENVHANFIQTLGANTLFTSLFASLLTHPTHWVGAPAGYTREQLDAQLPPLNLNVDNGNGGTVALSIPATRSYLIPAPNTTDTSSTVGAYFLGLSSGSSILGFGVLRSLVVTFDVQNQRIGFAPSNGCATDLH